MVARTYYPEREPTFATPVRADRFAAGSELPWGYSLRDLHGIARLAVHTVGPMGMDWHERYDIAYSAIAEHLCASETAPPRHDLVRAGQLGIYAVVSDHYHHHGYYKAKTIGGAAGPGSSPAFARYWAGWCRTTSSCESAVVDRIALRQILDELTDRQVQALAALGALDDYRATAAALDIEMSTLKSLLARARGRFRELWHEGEKPSGRYRLDKRVFRYDDEEPAA
jgi:hypothetical protein